MTKKEKLIAALRQLVIDDIEPEGAHCSADDLVLNYINDEDIRTAWDAVPKWYA